MKGNSNSFGNLRARTVERPRSLQAWNGSMVPAVRSNAFKNSSWPESVYDAIGKVIFFEYLCSPKAKDGTNREYPISEIAEEAYAEGEESSIDFDVLTTSLAIRRAAESGEVPFSSNISVASASSPEFFDRVIPRITRPRVYQQKQLTLKDAIFEILERDANPNTNVAHMHKLREQGVRFALDDIGKGQSHQNRLAAFGRVVDIIKIDGPYIRGYIEDGFETRSESGQRVIYKPKDLVELLEKTQTSLHRKGVKDTMYVAERARNMDEIKRLEPLGFTGFQSYHLKPYMFNARRNASTIVPNHSEILTAPTL